MYFSDQFDQEWKTRKHTANARVTVDIDLSLTESRVRSVTTRHVGRTFLVGFIFYAFSCNYLNRTRWICVQVDFLEEVRFALDVGETCMVPRRYFQHAHFIPIVGVGKRGEY